MTFLTVHILHELPLHNMNRDQSGQPKSQFDGGVQRARLSSQALKRAARVSYLGSNTGTSVRTRDAVGITLDRAVEYAAAQNLPFNEKAGRAAIKKVIDGLAKADKPAKGDKDAEDKSADSAADEDGVGDNILFFAQAELSTLAVAAVHKQQDQDTLVRADFIQDATSPSLDVAAFGRMFAAATEVGTHAAVAVSHAATTHQMMLTSDYFTAVEEGAQSHNGAAHLGMSYYTSGVYYRSFTIDVDQLRRSWASVDQPGARDDLNDLVIALIRSLPSGRVTNSNPHTVPSLVLAEVQQSRVAYPFDTPVQPVEDGGYLPGSVAALARQRGLAVSFDPHNTPRAVIWGDTFGHDFQAAPAADVHALAAFVADEVYSAR